MMKNWLVMVFSAWLVCAPPAWSADASAALQLAQTTSERMLSALRENHDLLQREPTRIYGLVDKIVLPHFDFITMARWVLGKNWKQASAEQRTRFTEEFRTLLVRTYAKALLEYSDEKIHFLPVQASAADEVTVRSEIQPKSGPAIPVDYSMHEQEGGWKVYDVAIDGVSLVANYRGSIGDQVRKQGIESVINQLSERNTQEGR